MGMGLWVTRGGEAGTTGIFESGPEILESPQSSLREPGAGPLQPQLHTEHCGEDERISPQEHLDPVSGPCGTQ